MMQNDAAIVAIAAIKSIRSVLFVIRKKSLMFEIICGVLCVGRLLFGYEI